MPSASGPRCLRASRIFSSADRATAVVLPSWTIPAIPHIFFLLFASLLLTAGRWHQGPELARNAARNWGAVHYSLFSVAITGIGCLLLKAKLEALK